MLNDVTRRNFLSSVAVGAAAVTAGQATYFAGPRPAHAAFKAKGNIPDKPFKTGHITFLTGPANLLGEPGRKGHLMAAEEINAEGGLLGKRKIETIMADEAAGTDANVKELRRMKLSENIDLFTGVISSGNTPALGPVAEELQVLTLFNDGCTDFLFDKAVPKPKYTFRVTNIQSADGVTSAVGAAKAWPNAKRVGSIQPDYSYGRNVHEHFMLAFQKLVPGATAVSEAWPKLGATDFTPHITKLLSDQPEILICGLWGGDYVAFYKQALRYGLFDKMKVATTLAFGGQPHAIGKDHPEGCLPAAMPTISSRTRRKGVGRSMTRSLSVTTSVGTSIRVSSRMAPTRRSTCLRERLRRPIYLLADGLRMTSSSPCSRAWEWIRRPATSTSGPTTTKVTKTRSSG